MLLLLVCTMGTLVVTGLEVVLVMATLVEGRLLVAYPVEVLPRKGLMLEGCMKVVELLVLRVVVEGLATVVADDVVVWGAVVLLSDEKVVLVVGTGKHCEISVEP